MRKFKNITDEAVVISNIPAIAPGETYPPEGFALEEEIADRLARCPQLQEVTSTSSRSSRRKTEDEKSEETE